MRSTTRYIGLANRVVHRAGFGQQITISSRRDLFSANLGCQVMRNDAFPKPEMKDLTTEDIETIAALVAERLNGEALSQFLDEREAAKFVGLSHRALQAMRYDGTGPAFVKLGDHNRSPVRYSRSDLIQWVKSRRRYRRSTKSDAEAA